MHPSPLYRPYALPAMLIYVTLGALALVWLTGCNGPPPTSNGVPITNQALATAVGVVHTSELAATTLANALTAGYQAGTIPRPALQTFQSQIAPKISAALATAKAALQTWQTAPSQNAEVTAATALLNLAKELDALQGFFRDNALIPAGGAQ